MTINLIMKEHSVKDTINSLESELNISQCPMAPGK